MKKLGIYLRLQLRRAGRLLPRMLAVTLLLAVLTGLAALLLARLQEDDEAKAPVHIGIVGDPEKGHLGEALQMLETMDSSRFSLRFETMDREEAARALRRGRIDGYAVVPEDFAYAMMIGEHHPITYVTNRAGADLGAQIVRELAETISSLVLETENAVYGAQDFAAENAPGVDPYAVGDGLVFRYVLRIMDRERLFELETIGAADALTLPGHYLCGLPLLFVMLWAVSCSPLFSGRSRELGQLLAAAGLRAPGQILAEFLGYLLLMLCALLGAGLAAGLLALRFGLRVPELAGLGGGEALSLLLAALPAALMLCALSFLLYELAGGGVAGILLQFLNAAVQGYLAGCFYPSAFFPEGLRRLGACLPAGIAMARLRALLLGQPAAGRAAVWGCLLLFLLAAVCVRGRRNRA